MEGENKDMKMKKLTALALAGVLCLGMSTTAFAAASPLPKDAVTATNDENKEVTLEQSPINTETGTFAGWNSKKPEKVDESVRYTLEDRLDEIKKDLRDEDSLTGEELKALKEEQTTLNELLSSDKKFAVVTLADITTDAVVDEENPINIKFSLNGDTAWKGIKAGEAIRILHQVNGQMIVLEGTVQWNEKDGFFVEQEFDSLSPIAILRFTDAAADNDNNNNNNDNNTPNPTPNPGDDTTVTPGTNGNITADQLADLIVKKLQNADASKVVRVVSSSKASPKTGE